MIKLLNNICKVAVIFLLTASTSFAADKVKLRLNWMYYGSHAGFALGFVDGTMLNMVLIWTSDQGMDQVQHTD